MKLRLTSKQDVVLLMGIVISAGHRRSRVVTIGKLIVCSAIKVTIEPTNPAAILKVTRHLVDHIHV